MNKKVEKELKRVSGIVGEEVTEALLQQTALDAIHRLMDAGLPKKHVLRMLKAAKPLGDFKWFEERMPLQEFNEFFGGPVRRWGLDGSVDVPYGCYGASTMSAIHNISPWNTSINVFEELRGKPSKKDPEKEEIFLSGHLMEPVYRNFFRYMFSHRYVVFDCDIQFYSKKYKHCLVNVDGILLDLKTGEYGILEIKHTTARNINVIKKFESGQCPEYYDIQVQTYMEVLDADFACVFLGWGNRPGLDTNATVRVERRKAFAENALEGAEDFMVNNVNKGVRPSFKGIKKTELAKQAISNLYGSVQASKVSVDLEDKLLPALEALEAVQTQIKEAGEKEKQAKNEKEKLQEEFEALSLPIIEALGNSPSGNYVNGKKHYTVSYDVKNALDVEKVKRTRPDVYDECNKLAVDTSELKRKYPDVYSECFGPKVNGSRSFDLKVWESKK